MYRLCFLALLASALVATATPPQYSLPVKPPQYSIDCPCPGGCACGPVCLCIADESAYSAAASRAISDNVPLAVAVGVDNRGIGIRADWLASHGYTPGVHWFAPDGGKLWYVGTIKPKMVVTGCETGKCSYTYFPPRVSAASCSSCAAGR